jgi:hypothetical protein
VDGLVLGISDAIWGAEERHVNPNLFCTILEKIRHRASFSRGETSHWVPRGRVGPPHRCLPPRRMKYFNDIFRQPPFNYENNSHETI